MDRYRPNAGTVVQVVNYTNNHNGVLGVGYISYNSTGLAIMCPTSCLDEIDTKREYINRINPPTLPVMYGMFDHEVGYNSSDLVHDVPIDRFPKTHLCPAEFARVGLAEPPVAQGCFLRSRSSTCRIGYNVPFFAAIVACLGLKLACLVMTLLVVKEPPILTVGDAIAEYLHSEDLHTKGCSLTWTIREGWKCVGPIETYSTRPASDSSCERQRDWLKKQWAKVWPSRENARHDDVPKWGIMNFSNTMKSMDKPLWMFLYLSTLGVAAGVFTYVARQDGRTTTPRGGERYVSPLTLDYND